MRDDVTERPREAAFTRVSWTEASGTPIVYTRTDAQRRRDLCAYARWHVADAQMSAGEDDGYSAARWADAAVCLLSALLLAVAISLAPTVAAAQSDEVALLRTAWSECSYTCTDDEIAALHLVISSTAEREGIRYRTAWRLLSRRLAAGTVSRAWLADLDTSCREPEGWPESAYVRRDGVLVLVRHAPWSAFRGRCEALVERVRAVIAGTIAHRCEATPVSWGSDFDADTGEARGRAVFVEVECGETSNAFGEWLPIDAE